MFQDVYPNLLMLVPLHPVRMKLNLKVLYLTLLSNKRLLIFNLKYVNCPNIITLIFLARPISDHNLFHLYIVTFRVLYI